MSFMTSTFTHTHTSSYPTDSPARLRSDLLDLLHDHHAMATLNPLVTDEHVLPHPRDLSPSASPNPQLLTHLSVFPQADSPGWETRSITDLIPNPLFLNMKDMTVISTASFQDTPTGLKTLVTAAAGVRIEGEWRIVEETENGEIVLEERAVVTANILTSTFIKMTMKSSHEVLHKRLGEKLQERIGL